MDKENNRRRHSPNELVSQYRDIGIPAVAAAARYQSPDRVGTRPRRQDDSQDDARAGENQRESGEARRR
ncbi:MAG: hypothetical protein K2Y27_35015 [Xanthobacteraceae bacterium]|nr:hypothetical protein [Xanthobacteraceae bacterium]